LVSVPPTTSAFYRCLIGGLALAAYLCVSGRRRWPLQPAWIALAVAAVFFSLDLWFWHRSVLLIGPGLSTLLANLQVFFMIAAGVVLYRERPTALQLVAAPLALAGLAAILGGDWFGLDLGFRRGVVFGVLTAMCYAGYLLSLRRARFGVADALPAVEVVCISLLVAVLLGIAAAAEGSSLSIPTASDFAWLLAYGVLAHAFGVMLIASGLAQVTAAEVGIALLLQPVLSLIWDGVFFDRPFRRFELVGVAITLLAIYLGSQRRLGRGAVRSRR
jgi:drug/metabolite transporter (DMT)-like permease